MEGLENLLVDNFVDKETNYLKSVDNNMQLEGMSKNMRIEILTNIMLKGIRFGLTKGGFIEKCLKSKIEKVKNMAYDKWLKELIYSFNEDIEEYRNKIKYKY